MTGKCLVYRFIYIIITFLQWVVYRSISFAAKRKHHGTTDSFERFQQLPTEIRLQVWGCYFDFPSRIHVLHPGPDPDDDLAVSPPAYTQLARRTNQYIQSRNKFAAAVVSREAREILVKAFDSVRMPFQEYEEAKASSRLWNEFRSRYPSTTSMPQEQSIQPPSLRRYRKLVPSLYMNWDDDLLYLADPEGQKLFRGLCSAEWVHKVQRIALLLEDPAIHIGRNRHLLHQRPGGLPLGHLYNFLERTKSYLKHATKFKQIILVFRLGKQDRLRTENLERDGFGFVPYHSITQLHGRAWSSIQMETLIRDMTRALSEAFPYLRGANSIRFVVDVDCIEIKGDRYLRHLR
ncbi:hypothetical protein F5B20DRAFT_542358 [Whalleya microplaca]|nr:hypothetical protein F5B20DRAFT_542358 [Whalleya microplaca]